ncbi:gas vesicle protein [Dactylosporangium aurantiacum]|uniref:Gas vesicle protein A n=1 Tax=Dactylosporangium aurantiacum TaxID=35754 RepID=A0A9Q9MCW7_9ACTN|nr:gas vesicle protein GvpJ [Dactylosporangium aurantiacum]MDG6107117.1 gas vesicle protein [Dactylosporangium aurantiacum]UWZ51414.1 gas vesicle protein [Dactylosporangium aurantiacum]
MSVVQSSASGGQSSSLADVIDTILDKGLVIDAHVSVGVVGIEILTIDARVVVASVDTYLRFAEAANRLDMRQQEGKGLPDVVGGAKGAVAGHAGRRAVEGAGEQILSKAGDVLAQIAGPSDEDRDRPRRRRGD